MANDSRLVMLPPKHTNMESLSEGYKEDKDSVVYINPVSKIIARGEDKLSVGYKPNYSEPIVNFETHVKQKALVESGKMGDYKGLGGFTKEWYPKVMEFTSAYRSGGKRGIERLAESGMLTGADFATVKSALLALKTTETPIRNHIILELVTRMQSDRLDLRIDDFAGFDAINEDMGVWTIPLGGKGGFTSQTFSQKKYGWHLQWSEDFTMQYYDVDVMGYHVRALRGQMEKVMNQKCAALFNALSATAQGSWSAFSGGLSTRNAKIDVKNIATVVDNTMRGTPQAILSNRAVYDVYQSNTSVQPGGLGAFANVRYTFGNGIITGTGGFDSIKWGVDDLITTDRYTVFDPAGIVFVEGPQRTAQYEDSRTGIRGTIFKRWFTAKIIDTADFNTGSTVL